VSRKNRKEVFLRARCHYCGGKATTKDHYVPVFLGGTTDVNNLVPACEECNRIKDSRIPEAFFAFCAEVLALKSPRYEGFRHKAKAILLKHAPELLPGKTDQVVT
jgi:hypothetical protein